MAAGYNLTKEFIEEVRAASDIVRVVGQFVRLRKRGKNHVGLCPFHDEKTPSFNVRPDRQMFYCFGCGAGGDVFNFLMRHENMDFPDAVVEMAKAANLRIPRRSGRSREEDSQRAGVVEANEAALAWFRAQLGAERGEPARRYLAERGIDEAAVEAFELGFAPEALDGLLNHLRGAFSPERLEEAGLVQRPSSGETIDRFRKRIIVPIRSPGGRLVAFGGRIFGSGEPKFINSPETPVFRKSRNLFGLHRGARAIRRSGFAILVEGYFDVIVLHQRGFSNAVAPLGTSLTEEQAQLLRRYVEKAIVCMDADAAGQAAAMRAAGLLLEHGLAVNIAPLPEGEDPDSFVRRGGAEAFKELLSGSQPAYGYVLKETTSRCDLGRPQEQRRALAELLPLLNRISDPIEKRSAVGQTAQRLDIEQHVVITELNRLRGGPSISAAKEGSARRNKLDWLPVAERKLLLVAARDSASAREAVEELEVMEALSPFAAKLLSKIFERGGEGETASFTSMSDLADDEEEARAIAALAVEDDEEVRPNAWECAVAIAVSALRRRVAKLSDRIAALEETDVEGFDELHAEKTELTHRIIALEREARSAPSRGGASN